MAFPHFGTLCVGFYNLRMMHIGGIVFDIVLCLCFRNCFGVQGIGIVMDTSVRADNTRIGSILHADCRLDTGETS